MTYVEIANVDCPLADVAGPLGLLGPDIFSPHLNALILSQIFTGLSSLGFIKPVEHRPPMTPLIALGSALIPEIPLLVRRRQLARLLQLHLGVAALDFAVAALGAEDAAAACFAGVSLPQLIGHN